MIGRYLNEEKKETCLKESKEKLGNHKLKYLPEEIKKLRDELNKKVAQEGIGVNNEEVLKLSKRLDELIVRYY
ncbi:MAG TPA: aspartyl-phosphate phosphatase Spo0E family protein [Thermoclostridium sp.]|nr:aspartyl-phosphate phosphatase Spo0E family protein [Thermoclostridium sp.]